MKATVLDSASRWRSRQQRLPRRHKPHLRRRPPLPQRAAPARSRASQLSKQKWLWMSERNVDALAALFHEKAVFVHMGGTMTRTRSSASSRRRDSLQARGDPGGVGAVRGHDGHRAEPDPAGRVVGGNEVTNPFMVTEVYVQEGGARKLAALSFTSS